MITLEDIEVIEIEWTTQDVSSIHDNYKRSAPFSTDFRFLLFKTFECSGVFYEHLEKEDLESSILNKLNEQISKR